LSVFDCLKCFSKKNPTTDLNHVYECFDKEAIIADCKLYIALLTIMRQDIAAIIKTGLFELRRAWKIYTTNQRKLFELLKQIEPNAEVLYGADPNKASKIEFDESQDVEYQQEPSNNDDDFCIVDPVATDEQVLLAQGESRSNASIKDDVKQADVSSERVKKLLASISFGYGIMQLCFSFLPPSIMKLLKFIGNGRFFDSMDWMAC
jgi:hypothetical protein